MTLARRLVLALAACCLLPALAAAIPNTRGWCESGQQPVVLSGLSSSTLVQASYPACTVAVYVHGGALATIFSDGAGTPLGNPFTAQTNGQWQFYAASGRYDVTLSGAGFPSPVTYPDIVLLDIGAGTGSVTLFTAAGMFPIFTTLVSNASSTPNLVFNLLPTGPHFFLGNNSPVPTQPQYVQPAFTDLGGTLTCSQLPALTGSISTPAGSCVTSGTTGITSFATNDATAFGTGFATTSVLTPTTTPTLSFNLFQAAANTVWGNCTGSLALPSYCAITSAMFSPSLRRDSCVIIRGSDDGAALTNANIGPQADRCIIPTNATIIEIGAVADAGAPTVLVSRDRLGTVANLLTGSLTAGAGTANYACANATGGTSINSSQTCAATLQNATVNAGDFINVVSGVAGGTAKRLTVTIVWLVN